MFDSFGMMSLLPPRMISVAPANVKRSASTMAHLVVSFNQMRPMMKAMRGAQFMTDMTIVRE